MKLLIGGTNMLKKLIMSTASSLAIVFAMPLGAAAIGVHHPAYETFTNRPNHRKECKNNNWQTFTNPSFDSQKACLDFVNARAFAVLTMSNPNQKIKFDLANHVGAASDEKDMGFVGMNKVKYWNFDYPVGKPGGDKTLHYRASVICATVDVPNQTARFIFKIPPKQPNGLAGQIVAAQVSNNEGQTTYGHTTADFETANNWCQTGEGLTVTNYPVTSGNPVTFEVEPDTDNLQ